MKSLITAAASLIILLTLLLQFTHTQMLHSRLVAADQHMENFRERIKQDGCITEGNEKQLKKDLAEVFHCKEDQVSVKGDRIPVFRGERVFYDVEAPSENVIAMASFWGIDKEKNRFSYKVSRVTVSEYTGRQR